MRIRNSLIGFSRWVALCLILAGLSACKKQQADLILINGTVHTVNSGTDWEVAQAIAITGDKISAVGTTTEILTGFESDNVIDLQGKKVYPGFIDAHCHFVSLAKQSMQVDLVGTTSFEDVLHRVDSFALNHDTEWIVGRGWDQNDWDIRSFPDNNYLNEMYPDRPVILKRIDGHAAIANAEALRRAGITVNTKIDGGIIEVKRRKLTGLLVDNAVDTVDSYIPEYARKNLIPAIRKAEAQCISYGLTTVDDAGLDLDMINLLDSMQHEGILQLRIYAMANPNEENLSHFLAKGPRKTDRIHVKSFKLYADGALGSRGALLLAPYSDAIKTYGLLRNDPDHFHELMVRLEAKDFQVNTHCIGDSANRMILRLYSETLGGKNDKRWRIEHAQVVHPGDLTRFGSNQVIPSVQPTHATSDMPWAEQRLGKTRMKGAYAYASLYEQNKMLAFGSDFPVEKVNPLLGFYAAVERKDATGNPADGFLPKQKVSRDIALSSMTRWAAYSNFEEKEKGSIEAGKFADIVVLDRDIMYVDAKDILNAKVVYTILGGKIVYSSLNE